MRKLIQVNGYFIRALMLIVAYVIVGKLSLLLAIPPSIASPVWPAAGIALAGVLLGGYRYLPCVFLGSLIVNFIPVENIDNLSAILIPNLLISGIAIGATAQAALGTYLIKQVVEFPCSLESGRDIGYIMALGGPVACLVNATFSPVILVILGFVAKEAYLFSMLTWFVGDTLGVILVTPFLLIFLTANTRRKIVLLLPLFILIAIVITLFSYIRDIEQQNRESDFSKFSLERVGEFQELLNRYEIILDFLGQYYTSSDYITRDEFKTFTEKVLEENKDIQVLGWIPSSNANDKVQLSEQQKALARNNKYPAIYFEPREENNDLVNFQFSSNKSFLAGLNDARDSAKKIASVPLLRTDNNLKAFYIFNPVYRINTSIDTIKERQNALEGFTFGLFYMKDVIETVIDPQSKKLMDVYIYDNYLSGEASIFYGEKFESPYFIYKMPIEIAGRQWTLEFAPTSLFIYQSYSWQSWTMLVGGLLFAALFQAFLLILTARADISERLVEEKSAALVISERKHRNIVDNTLDGLITIDTNANIETFNMACEKMFGYDAEEVIGKNVKLIMPEPYHSEHDHYIKHYQETGEKHILNKRREVEAKRKNGSVFPVDLSVSEVDLGDRKIYSGILRDITENKKAQKQLEIAFSQLEVSNTELERFAYIASHDLQEPLRMIVNFTDILESEYTDKLDDTAKKYIKFSVGAASRMQQLISDLLEYSRIGQESEYNKKVDCNEIYHYACENLTEAIKQSNAKVTSDELPVLVTNPVRLTRLFQNLIGNGIKYQEKNKQPIIHVAVKEDEDFYTFSIHDNGIGIKKEYLEQIFSPFKRLHSYKEYKGSGIGLTVSKKIVENSGGKLWVESVYGEGSIFYFTLPKNIKESI